MKTRKWSILTAIVMVLCGMFCAPAFGSPQTSTNYALDSYVLSGGGGGASSASYGTISTLGQSTPTGNPSSSSYDLFAGFWAPLQSAPNQPSNPSPADGATGVSVNPTLLWTGGDPNPGDTVTYDVYFDTQPPDQSSLTVADDLTETTWSPSYTLDYNTTYYWKIVARDSQSEETEGPVWSFTTENRAPYAPYSPDPHNIIDIALDADLSWDCGDPDPGDTLTYDVYFGTVSPPSIYATDHGSTLYDPGALAGNTTYYWRIVARDNHGAETSGPEWSFTTLNQAPNAASNPSPNDSAIDIALSAALSWTGGDPDAIDNVTFDVYFGTGQPPSLVSAGQASAIYDPPGDLLPNTTYSWQIVTEDNHGATTDGPVWSFSTLNRAPYTPSSPTPANGATEIPLASSLSWSGGDPDPMDTVTYDVYFDTVNPPVTRIVQNHGSTTYDPGGMSEDTEYFWKIVSRDDHGVEVEGPVWSFTSVVDVTDPVLTSFTVRDASSSSETITNNRTVAVTIVATDNSGNIAYYLIKENSTEPDAPEMYTGSATLPTTYTIQSAEDGTKTMYAWVMDAAENISTMAQDSILLDTDVQVSIDGNATVCLLADNLTVSGTMEDSASVTVVSDTTASVGTVSYPTSSTWEVDITGLEIGDNVLTATATDAAENQANSQITVRHSIPNTATIDKALNSMPADGVGTNLLTITVRDANSQLVCDGTPLDITTTLGSIPAGPYTTTNGVFTCNLTASTDLGTATINVLYNQNVIGTTQVIMEAGDISRLVFTTPVRSTPVDQPSQYIIVETQDAYGHAINVSTNTTVLLSSTAGSSGSFSTDNTNWYTGSINHVMQSGENYIFFWFRSSDAGQFTIDAFAIGKTWDTGYQQINVYVEDNDAPTTTPSPMCADVVAPYECYYSSSQAVTLSCDDGSGSGCDTTYYSTDGTNPPTIEYTGPISITQDTVLRFYSTDSSGNDEAVQTVSYYIDSVDPTVTIASPTDGSTVKPLDAISGTAEDNTVNGLASVSVRVKNPNNRYLRNDSGTWTFGLAENWIEATGTTSWELTPPNYVWTDNSQYEVTARATDQAGNTAMDTITFTYAEQGEPSVITCNLSSSTITLGDTLTISGTISGEISGDPPNAAATGVQIELDPPIGPSVLIPDLADDNGYFEYDITCSDITREGAWIVRVSWAGEVGHLEGAVSDDQNLTVLKADSQLTMDVAASAVKFGEPVNISGKFTPQPYCGEVPLEVTVSLVIDPPNDPVYTENVTPNSVGDFLLQDYMGLDDLGEWTVYANFSGNTAYNSATSETITINVVESAGYAIVVQGRVHTEEGIASHNKTTNFVYNKLLERGLLPEDIQYFNFDSSMPEVDEIPQYRAITPTKTLVGDAITDWARDKMIGTGGKPANLYIIMVDHGYDDRFYIDQGDPTPSDPPVPSDPILASDMDGWLDTLQSSLEGTDAENQEIILVLGFCRAGSFIDDLSGDSRVIIASAAAGESSYKGTTEGVDIPDGEYFVTEFFKSAVNGKSIRRSFEDAVVQTEIYTEDTDSTGNLNGPYFDNSLQHPLLDDNGDGVGSNDITDQNGDGDLSSELFIGVSLVTTNDPGDAYIEDKTETIFLDTGQETVNLWAIVNDVTRVGTIWVEIKPPNFTPLDPGGSGQASLNLTPIPTDTHVVEDGRDKYLWNNVGGFVEPGTYQIFYYVKDSSTGNISPLVVGRIYKAKSVNHAPAAFSLLRPENQFTANEEVVLFDWNDTTDPDGDRLTYTIRVSENSNFDNPIVKEFIPFSTCVLSRISDGLEDGTHYFWQVQAIDAFGEIQPSTETWEFDTNFVNAVFPAWVEGFVYDASTYATISQGTVTIDGTTFYVGTGGYYLGLILPDDNITVVASADGYEDEIVIMDIPNGGVVSRNFGLTAQALEAFGNVDGDQDIDLQDAILAMQVMNASASGISINLDADVNGDNRIGLAEAIYILHILADIRQTQ